MIRRVREIWRFRELIRNLTRVNLLVKYRGSMLGFFWSLLNPLLMIFIYSIAFKYILRIGLENYTFFLLVGLLPWSFFNTAVAASTVCVINGGGLLKKVQLPREVFPLSTVAFFLVQLLLAMLALGPFSVVWKEQFIWINLLYVGVLVLFVLFTIGVCLAVSALTVFYRDLEHFTEIAMVVVFWGSPIIYNFELIPESWRPLFLANPVVLYMNCFHDLLYWDRLPDPAIWAGVCAWPLVLLLAGALVFQRLDGRFAEEI